MNGASTHRFDKRTWWIGSFFGSIGRSHSTPASTTSRSTARGPHPDRGKAPRTVIGIGKDETAALRDLDATLRGAKPTDGLLPRGARSTLRVAYVDGAEQWARANVGRALTHQELHRVLERLRV